MIQINDIKDCCGCTACDAVCPKDAISMKADALGFKYPEVDLDKCIDCHLCEKVCSFNPDYDKSLNFSKPLAFGVRHKDMKEVETSRSGGAFIAISDVILDRGGVVYGAALLDDLSVGHIRVTDKSSRQRLKGSKYVQSDLNGIFRSVRQDLKDGLTVMFTGTPCQTSGLRSYIGKKLGENLYLVDIVCHGVPSPTLWKDNLTYLQNRWKTKIKSANFRDKRFGWFTHRESYQTDKGTKFAGSFTRGFYLTLSLRTSCANCHFGNIQRPSDISLAGFWGSERVAPEWNADDKGLSLVLANTAKGQQLLQEASASIDCRQYDIENCMQNQLRGRVKFNPQHDEFQKDYAERGFGYAMKKYKCIGFQFEVYSFLSRLKRRLVKLLK